MIREIELYSTSEGLAPFEQWLGELREPRATAEVYVAIDAVCNGRFDHCTSVGTGVYERRLGKGSRFYFALLGDDGLVLLAGGSAKTRREDAAKALECWKEFKEHAH